MIVHDGGMALVWLEILHRVANKQGNANQKQSLCLQGFLSPLVSRSHVEALEKVDAALSTVLQGMDDEVPSDLLAIDIRKALHYLGEVTGEVTTDDLLGTIFSRFCIGK